MLNKLLIVLLVLFTASCGNYDRSGDSISSGQLKIGVDDSYSFMIDSQIFVYEQIYKKAKITPSYMPEGDVIQALLDDSIQAAIISRPLSEQEMEFFKSKQRIPESTKIAVDGVALVVNPNNPDTVLTMDQLAEIFKGIDTTWSQVIDGSTLGNLRIVFDNNKSCNERTLREKFIPNGQFPSTCFAVHSNEEVINYVSQNPNAIGIISVSWISDRDEPKSVEMMKKVKPIRIIDPTNKVDPQMARGPFQAYIFDESYPLRRDVYAIRTGLRGTLGTGFVSHLAGEKGQLIIHKMGMVAANSPVRTIRLTE